MRVTEYRYEVRPVIEFVEDEADFLVACSRDHYDLDCKAASLPGPNGFLHGIKSMFLVAGAETVKYPLSFRELHRLLNILECPNDHAITRSVLSEKIKAILRTARIRKELCGTEAGAILAELPPGRCPSVHGLWRCSEPAVGPHVHALRDSDGRPVAVWLDDGRLLLTPDLPGEDDAFDAADEGDRMIALALLDNAHSIALCTIDSLAEDGGEAAKRSALLAVELLHALCCMIAELDGETPCEAQL